MTSNNNSGGIGICGLTFLVFLTLKLTGVIAWSWWWVTAPLWGPVALFAVLFLAVLPFALAKVLKGHKAEGVLAGRIKAYEEGLL